MNAIGWLRILAVVSPLLPSMSYNHYYFWSKVNVDTQTSGAFRRTKTWSAVWHLSSHRTGQASGHRLALILLTQYCTRLWSAFCSERRVSAPAAFAAAGDQPVIITRYVVDFCYVLRAPSRRRQAAVQRSSVVVNLPKTNNRMTAAVAAIDAALLDFVVGL